MAKDPKEGPMNVVNQKILLPLPSKRFLKIAPETKLFLRTGVKGRILIEDEERAALRYNVLARECEFFPGSYLTCRPGYTYMHVHLNPSTTNIHIYIYIHLDLDSKFLPYEPPSLRPRLFA